MITLKDVLNDSALRGYLDWNYPNLHFHVQLQKHKNSTKKFINNITRKNH
jgi:hypothetical protein